jgi:hypothetical protein
MGLRSAGLRFLAICIALCVGIMIGSYGVNLALAQNNNENNSAPKYQVNESGQTYGSSMEAESIETEPDLIWACGIEGESGYIKKTDLNGDMPKTPEEAVKITQENSALSREIPLYDKDGETIIGSFRINATKAYETTVEDVY